MKRRPVVGSTTIADRFRVTGLLGEGATSVVYRAEQLGGGPDVALKILDADGDLDPEFVGRFRRGARASAKLAHENAIRIHDFGEDAGRLYLAMELLEGRDLFEVLAEGGPLPEPRAVRIAIQICRALEAAHAEGIVHRDLKPENVHVAVEAGLERVKVLDFGIAKPMAGASAFGEENAITSAGIVVGTPEYMAPEQCMGAATDARSDVYSLGVVLFQMLTCRTPFEGPSAVAIALAHTRLEPPPLDAIVPGIDPRLAAVVARCLAKLPVDRFASAKELREALEPLAEVEPAPREPTLLRARPTKSLPPAAFGPDEITSEAIAVPARPSAPERPLREPDPEVHTPVWMHVAIAVLIGVAGGVIVSRLLP